MADRAGRRALRAVERPKKPPRPRVKAIGSRLVVTEGVEHDLWRDFYHNSLTADWPQFFAFSAAAFVAINLVFALIYSVGADPIANANSKFWNYFFFSVETTSTVGYGDMHPQSLFAHVVATIENFIGMMLLACMTGLVFARISRPRARVIFAEAPVVAQHDGVPTLMMRAANARSNMITEATAKLWVLMGRTTKEGRTIVGFQPLRLIKSENPSFGLSWTLFHPIDESSPLHGLSEAQISGSDMSIIVSLSGVDDVSAQPVNARHAYPAALIRFGHEYVDIHRLDDDGLRHVDYAKIHDTRLIGDA